MPDPPAEWTALLEGGPYDGRRVPLEMGPLPRLTVVSMGRDALTYRRGPLVAADPYEIVYKINE